jgi:UDP-glucuronate decarboxylase
MIDLIEQVSKAVGNDSVKYQIVDYPDTYPADEPNRRCPDITKATQQLGYAPRIGLEEGLSRFFNWAEKAYRE